YIYTVGRLQTRYSRDWSSDVCSSDLPMPARLKSSNLISFGSYWPAELAAIGRSDSVCSCCGRMLDHEVCRPVRGSLTSLITHVRSEERRLGEDSTTHVKHTQFTHNVS